MSQPTFQPFKPIRIATQEIFNAANSMVLETIEGTLNVSAVADFQKTFVDHAYEPVHKEGQPFMFRQEDMMGETCVFQADMWKTTYQSQQTGQDKTDRLLLINEVIVEGDQAVALQPRLIVDDGQMVFPYQMTCCGGLSAIRKTRNGVALIESAKVQECMKDIFGVTSNPAIQMGSGATAVLDHWEGHVAQKTTTCSGHIPLKIPARRPVFS